MPNIPIDEYIRVQALDDLGTQEFITTICKLSNTIINKPIIQSKEDIEDNTISVFSVKAFMDIFTKVIEIVNDVIFNKDEAKEELDKEQTRLEDGTVYRNLDTINTNYMNKSLEDIDAPINGTLYIITEEIGNKMYLYLNDGWIDLGIAYTNDLWHKSEINKLREVMYQKLLTIIPDNEIITLTHSTFNSVIE